MNNYRTGWEGARGFTLLESILVLFLIGLIAGVATPFVMSTLDRTQHQAEAREIASALRYARSEAISRKTMYTFNGDSANGKYWLTDPEGGQSSTIHSLESGFRMVRITSGEETIADGDFIINFYPRGNSSGGSIRVQAESRKDAKTTYAIIIDPITGSSRIRQETQ